MQERSVMTRREKLLHGVSVHSSVDIEIGALRRPFIRLDDGETIYVVHADAAALRVEYRGGP